MNENIFVKYLSKKILKEKTKNFEPGPVITISRQFGCYATAIAAGAIVGSMFAPGLGTVVGGAIGAVVGATMSIGINVVDYARIFRKKAC